VLPTVLGERFECKFFDHLLAPLRVPVGRAPPVEKTLCVLPVSWSALETVCVRLDAVLIIRPDLWAARRGTVWEYTDSRDQDSIAASSRTGTRLCAYWGQHGRVAAWSEDERKEGEVKDDRDVPPLGVLGSDSWRMCIYMYTNQNFTVTCCVLSTLRFQSRNHLLQCTSSSCLEYRRGHFMLLGRCYTTEVVRSSKFCRVFHSKHSTLVWTIMDLDNSKVR
jgi:hypothetical protein